MVFKKKKEFKELFDEMYNPLCNFVFRIVSNDQYTKDIVQDVFISLWERNKALDVNTNLKSYLFGACKKNALAFLRSEQIRQKHILTSTELSALDTIDVEADAVKYMRLEKLLCLIRQLPPKCQEVFLMQKQNGLTYREIANELNISTKTVENHMVKALKFLRKNTLGN